MQALGAFWRLGETYGPVRQPIICCGEHVCVYVCMCIHNLSYVAVSMYVCVYVFMVYNLSYVADVRTQ